MSLLWGVQNAGNVSLGLLGSIVHGRHSLGLMALKSVFKLSSCIQVFVYF